jgi:prepilin-type N-terminal cleavage/methylation domain-containing protein
MSARRRGFTMIEMVIVMLVIGILAAAAAPRFFSTLARYRVERAAHRIAADLNYVRETAISKGVGSVGEWVSFITFSDEYRLLGDPDINRPSTEYHVRLKKAPYRVDLVSAQFTNTSGTNGAGVVKYDMYGCAKVGIPPFFPDKPLASGQIVVAAGNQQRTVVISPVTGKASVL